MKNLHLFLTILILSAIISCKKDRKEDEPTPSTPTTTISIPVIGGFVTDENGNALSDVMVQFGNYITTTNWNGEFIIENLTSQTSRAVIKFFKSGYFDAYRTVITENGKPIIINVAMINENSPIASTKNFYANTADSVILNDGSIISFPPNAFIKSDGSLYSGLVTIKTCYLDPTTDNYALLSYGGPDNLGINSNNNQVYLTPIKALIISIKDENGNPLQLDTLNNKKATIKFAIPNDLLANAPNSAPVWVYAPNNGVKLYRGDANKEGNAYVCQVGHFSHWSCELPSSTKATITGKVYKIISGVEYKGAGIPVKVGNSIVFTDVNGTYRASVPAQQNINVSIKCPGINENYSVLTQPNQVHTINFDISNLAYVFSATIKKNTGELVSNALISCSMYDQNYNGYHILTYPNSQGVFSLFKAIDLQLIFLDINIKSGKSKRDLFFMGSNMNNDLTGEIIWLPGRTYFKKQNSTLFDSNIDDVSASSSKQGQSISFNFSNESQTNSYSLYFTTDTNITQGSLLSGIQISFHDGQSQKTLSGDLKITKFINSTFGLIEGYFINLKDSQNINYEFNFSSAYVIE
ncbi:MAG: carboxypeptidase-like regulatory domain-containing protein [Bacteroidales bacterium]|nr:carboxypeptidase-like regulatory domain-containing protein [Bacteroidales bacterium]